MAIWAANADGYVIDAMLDTELQQAIVDFVTSFEAQAPAIVDDMQARHAAEVAGLFHGVDRGIARDAAAIGVAVALSAMRMPPGASTIAPDAAVREARAVAAEGGTLAALLHGYRVGHAVIQEHMLAHAERTGAPMTAVRVMSDRLFVHVDRLMQQANHEYMDERRRRNGDVDLALYTRTKRALAGEPETLPYPYDGHHIAVVFDPHATPDAAERLATELELPSLRVATPGGEIWLWLNVSETTTEGDVRSVLEAVLTAGAAGVSEPTTGAGSLAVAHRQATLASRLGTLRRSRVSSYSEVALEALAFGGQDAARDFTRAELGLLADDGERAEMLRRTVQTYFASGSSAAAAAAELGVAERTVTYRLRRAEELVGRPLSARRAEIEAALRLHRVLEQVA
jgi:hypothetical protein